MIRVEGVVTFARAIHLRHRFLSTHATSRQTLDNRDFVNLAEESETRRTVKFDERTRSNDQRRATVLQLVEQTALADCRSFDRRLSRLEIRIRGVGGSKRPLNREKYGFREAWSRFSATASRNFHCCAWRARTSLRILTTGFKQSSD